ncbi:MAG: hypothetical protein ACLFTT_17000 [Candidatus Hydrogenedentota bacterium]
MKHASLVALLLLLGLPSLAHQIHCPGAYDGHLQGIAVDAQGNIYWSFTTTLVKTDAAGTRLQETAVPAHHGDLWVQGKQVYAAVNHRASTKAFGKRDSWIYAYSIDDLALVWKKELPEVAYGAGGLTMRDGHFFVVSGRLPKHYTVNYVYEYDADGTFIERHVLESGHTFLGIQTIAYTDGTWWCGSYGSPPETIRAGGNLTFEERFPCDCSLGIAPRPDNGFYIARGGRNADRKHVGWVITVDQPAPATRETRE